jgi:hypothetical protein
MIFRQATFAVLPFALIVAAHVTALGQTPKQSPSPVNVTVTNTPSQPVPVTGTVNVGNLGTNPVPVSGVVGVQNAVGSSLLTRNLDGSARQRVFHSFYGEDSQYRVPDGKLLVIDYFSGIVAAAPTDPMPIMVVNAVNEPNRFYYFTPNSWFDYGGGRNWVWGTQTQMFFPAGYYVHVYKFFDAYGIVTNFSYHGHLVDVP